MYLGQRTELRFPPSLRRLRRDPPNTESQRKRPPT